MNELFSFFINFYFFNNLLFILLILLIFFTTIICINFLKLNKNYTFSSINNFFKIFNFFQNFLNFNFIRKQNLSLQNTRKPVNRLIKKKKI